MSILNKNIVFAPFFLLLLYDYILVNIEGKMKRLKEIQKCLRTHKKELKKNYKVKEIGIFGSYIRGDQKEKSDLDVLVDFDETIGLFRFVALERYLSRLLGVKVDLVMKSALKPRIGKRILNEVRYI